MYDGTGDVLVEWPWTNSAYVCITMCEWWNLTVLLIGVGRSMRPPCTILKAGIVMNYLCYIICYYYEVVISWVAFRKHHNFSNDHTLIFVGWICVWNGCRFGPGRTARTFVLLRSDLLLVFHVVVPMRPHHLISPSYGCRVAFRIHYNGDNAASASIFVVGWMMYDETGVVWPWTSRSYVCIAACAWSSLTVLLIGVRRSMRPSYMRHFEGCD